MGQPETRYAATPLGRIAYQVLGEGPIDLIVVHPVFLPIDLMDFEPSLARFRQRLASFSRAIWFDPRGRGASDPVPHEADHLAESMVDDCLALLDALGVQRSAYLDLTGMGGLLAATHPERVSALVLVNPRPRLAWAEDYPHGVSDEEIQRRLSWAENIWGTGQAAEVSAPSRIDDQPFVAWLARCERLSCSPAEAVWRQQANYLCDTRATLGAIGVPTLVIHRDVHTRPLTAQGGDRDQDELRRRAADAELAANRIKGARFTTVPALDHLFFTGDSAPLIDAIEEFLTGRLPTPPIDRVLATVLFTDVVGSTEHAARLGDRGWRELLSRHDDVVRAQVEHFRGREIKSIGDGFLVTFDGPGRAITAARAITSAVRPLGIEVRAGLHTGEIELVGDDVAGIAVHTAQRVQATAGPGEVVVSRTVVDLVAGSGIGFEDRGEHQLKGVPGPWQLFTVVG